MSLKHEFNYGWCYTDQKKDGRVFWGISRYYEYSYSPQFHATTKKLFEELALPMPKKEEFFHGTYSDIAFVDSHGLVVRVGPAKLGNVINPLILQPIGWRSLKDITVSIYPGIEIAEHIYPWETYPRDEKRNYHEKLQDFSCKMEASGCSYSDGYGYNMGVIRTPDEQGNENKDTLVILDPDDKTFSSTKEINNERKLAIEDNIKKFTNNSDIIAATIYDVFGDKEILQDNIKAFEKHQPLRRDFWNACMGINPNKEKLEALWDRCAELVNNPQIATVPVWKKRNDVYIRSEMTINSLVLHNNWRIKPEPPKKPSYPKY